MPANRDILAGELRIAAAYDADHVASPIARLLHKLEVRRHRTARRTRRQAVHARAEEPRCGGTGDVKHRRPGVARGRPRRGPTVPPVTPAAGASARPCGRSTTRRQGIDGSPARTSGRTTTAAR